MARTLVAVRHVEFEGLDVLAPVFRARGFGISYREAGRDRLDDAESADLLVVLGGPIAAYDCDRHPFLREECRIIERRIAASRPVLGICLGAQLIARSLGARNHRGKGAEIGWAPVQLTTDGLASPLRHLDGAAVLHWHGDTFDIPVGATLLASTTRYANQAFAFGPSVLALQFHPEVTAINFEHWLTGYAAELAVEGLNPDDLRRGATEHASGLPARLIDMVDDWLDAQTALGEPTAV